MLVIVMSWTLQLVFGRCFAFFLSCVLQWKCRFITPIYELRIIIHIKFGLKIALSNKDLSNCKCWTARRRPGLLCSLQCSSAGCMFVFSLVFFRWCLVKHRIRHFCWPLPYSWATFIEISHKSLRAVICYSVILRAVLMIAEIFHISLWV
jgi:hypothetical protein